MAPLDSSAGGSAARVFCFFSSTLSGELRRLIAMTDVDLAEIGRRLGDRGVAIWTVQRQSYKQRAWVELGYQLGTVSTAGLLKRGDFGVSAWRLPMPRRLGRSACNSTSWQQALASSKLRRKLRPTTTLRYSRIIRLAHCTSSRASEEISVDPDARFRPLVEADGSDHYDHCSVGPIVSNVKTKWILRPTRRTLPIMKHFSRPTPQLDLLPSPLTPPTWARGLISSPPFQLRHRHLA